MTLPNPDEIEILTALTRAIQDRMPLDVLLARIADGTASLLKTPRVSIRLFDPTRTRLIATARSGAPMHMHAGADFRLGEGLIGWIAEHVQPIRVGEAERDPRFQPRPDIVEPMRSFLGVPLVSGRACVGVLSALHPDHDHFDAHAEALLTLVAGISAPHVEVARLQRLSQVDPLTGALNRRGLDLVFPDGEGAVVPSPLTLIMGDVDHFKQVNDEWGHAIGDEVLKRVANLLSGMLRARDAVVRWGGEEFLLVLPEVGLAQAGRVAERARVALAESPVEAGGLKLPITMSFGVAERSEQESREALVHRADAALYAAKQAGRNRVVLADRLTIATG